MRFIHTADWHLGRLFHTVHLTDDQRYVLDQFVDLVADVRPAAVLVAGDIYDRGVPPTDAVELLNDVLQRIVRGLGVPVVMIAGNHDSPARLGFGAELMAGEGLHVVGGLPTAGALSVPFVDDDGVVLVQAIPYADPVEARAALADPGVQTHEQALAVLLARARQTAPRDGRGVLVAHAFVAGADTSDSERPLTVGGAGAVPAALFDGFDYVALGHLHRPQTAGADAVRYAGSLLTYSFDEAAQTRSVTVVEIGAPGSALLARAGARGIVAEAGGAAVAAPPALARVTVEQVVLRPRRRVRVLQGTLDDILRRAPADTGRDDYVCTRLTDPGVVLNAMAQLQQAYPNCLHLEFVRDLPTGDRGDARADPATKSEREHFADFFELVTDELLSSAQRERLDAVIADLRRDEREA